MKSWKPMRPGPNCSARARNRKKENKMTNSPASPVDATDRYVLTQEMPHITPAEGLNTRLLADATQTMSRFSLAEYVLCLHQEYNKVKLDGLPLGPNEQEVFDFYWEKVDQHIKSAVLVPLYTAITDDEETCDPDSIRPVFLTLHSDRSALLWQKINGDSYAPVPHPFYLDLSDAASLAIYPVDITPLHPSLDGMELSIYVDIIANSVGAPNRTVLSGEISLREAIAFEARQWIEWLPQALPVPCVYEDVAPAERVVLSAWNYDAKIATEDQIDALKGVVADFLRTMAIHHGLTEATGGISIMGRPLNRDGQLGEPQVFIGWGDAFDPEHPSIPAWENLLRGILNHPDCPVPRIAQIRQNIVMHTKQEDREIGLGKCASLLWVTEEINEGVTGHEAMECMNRITRFGIPLPPKA